ncbi:cytidylyltransferase domain-containing protein [Cohnella sp. GCM10027633]|uniref:acylneuraminate cytidylyltransferase family protein n=1 Tax=unclassified Cohnella TaxID=2636738 RepID=UPI00363E61BA
MKLCTICARGGSKGVKNKNIRLLAGKPLIGYSIEQAKKSGLFKYIAVSSDSKDILKIAAEFGADFCIHRPDELASDTAAKLPAIRHCVSSTEELTGETFEIIVDLDATSPLRIPDEIVGAVRLLESKNCGNVITGITSRRSPYFNLVELNESGAVQLSKKLEKPVVRRQDSPKTFDMNASIYVWRRDVLMETEGLFQLDTSLYEMPEEHSWDIDSELDFEFVELLMKKRANS